MRILQKGLILLGDCFYKRCEPKDSADYFATPPKAVRALCRYVKFRPFIIEPCCGEGHISKELQRLGYEVESSDIIYRGFGKKGKFDFLDSMPNELQGSDIVTNPPYNQAAQFIEHAIDCTDSDAKIAMLLRLTFLESQRRKHLFDTYPPTAVYVFRNRIGCAKNGEFKTDSHGELYYPSAVTYAWFLWDKSRFKSCASILDPPPPELFWLD